MTQRVLTAAVGAPLALAALFYLPRLGFLAVVLALCMIAASEFARLGAAHGASRAVSSVPLFVLVGVAVWGAPLLGVSVDPALQASAVALLLVFGAAVVPLWSGGTVRERALAVWLLGFGTLYLALPVVAFDQLRHRDPWLVVLLLAVVWLTDSGAFLAGSRWGRRKLAATVSPNKTWEGAVAGLLSGVVAAAVWSQWRLGAIEPWVLVAGALVSTAGQIGDLVESLFKRSAGVKDSGNLLPGHGGMLDRLDSLLVAAPVLELFLRAAGR